jgi:drug/metabolite transporter (DMT)-like permease
MPLTAVVLVLVAAVVHGSWNLLLKREGGRSDVMLGALVVGVALTAPMLAFYPLRSIPLEGWLLILLAALLETGYMLALSAAYAIGDLSLVYPVARGTAPIVVAPLAILLLGERPSLQGLAGVALVVIGIFGSHAASLRALLSPGDTRRALGFAFLTGLSTAGYSLVNKVGVGVVPVPVYGVSVFALNVVFFALVLRRRGPLLRVGEPIRWKPMLVIGAGMITSYILVLFAMSMAPVTYVVAAREVSIVVGAALGAFALRERHPVARITGAAIIFAGLVVLALA